MEREAPIRRMPPPLAAERSHDCPPHERRKRKRRRRRKGSALKDAAARGVNTAYSVVEEYVRRGYEAARAYERIVNQESIMGRYDRHRGCDRDVWNPMEAMIAPWMMMTRAWLDSMSYFIPGAGGMGSARSSRSGGSCGCGSASCGHDLDDSEYCPCGCGVYSWESCRGRRRRTARRSRANHCIALHVISPLYTEEHLDLNPDADEYKIKVEQLTYVDENGTKHTLNTKVMSHPSRRTIIRVKVEKDSKAGVYRADIYCGERWCGEVCVTVFADILDDDNPPAAVPPADRTKAPGVEPTGPK